MSSVEERRLLREIRDVLNVGYEDIPKTFLRFKREIEEMEKEMKE